MNGEGLDPYFVERQKRFDKALSLDEAMQILNKPYPEELAEACKADQFSRTDGNINRLAGRKCEGSIYVTYNPHWQCEVIEIGYKTVDDLPELIGGFIVTEGRSLPRCQAEILKETGIAFDEKIAVI